MSTFFFKTNISGPQAIEKIKPALDKLQQDKDIVRWQIHTNDPEHLLEVETIKLSSEELKHELRAAGIEAEFTKAPQARKSSGAF